jgi:hypothetical protein
MPVFLCGSMLATPPSFGYSSALGHTRVAVSKFDYLHHNRTQAQQALCFKKCVTVPGPTMSRPQSECLSNCVERFNESYVVVMKSFLASQGMG